MSELTERLRSYANPYDDTNTITVTTEAADRIEELEAEVKSLRETLGRPDIHLIKFDDSGWTVQHPPQCPDLFECWAGQVQWDHKPVPNGIYELIDADTIGLEVTDDE